MSTVVNINFPALFGKNPKTPAFIEMLENIERVEETPRRRAHRQLIECSQQLLDLRGRFQDMIRRQTYPPEKTVTFPMRSPK